MLTQEKLIYEASPAIVPKEKGGDCDMSITSVNWHNVYLQPATTFLKYHPISSRTVTYLSLRATAALSWQAGECQASSVAPEHLPITLSTNERIEDRGYGSQQYGTVPNDG